MRKVSLIFIMVAFSAALPLFAAPQQEPLGDVAKQVREERARNPRKASKVITNDDLPSRPAQATTPTTSAPSVPESISGKKPTPEKESAAPPESKTQTTHDWPGKLAEARSSLAHAKELQQLVEDELNLMQIQEARELNTNNKEELGARIQSKQTEVDLARTATADAQKKLDDLEKEFKDSGAPEK